MRFYLLILFLFGIQLSSKAQVYEHPYLSNVEEYVWLEKQHKPTFRLDGYEFGWEDFAWQFGTYVKFVLDLGIEVPGVEVKAYQGFVDFDLEEIDKNTQVKLIVQQGSCPTCLDFKNVGFVTVFILDTEVDEVEDCANSDFTVTRDILDSYRYVESVLGKSKTESIFNVSWFELNTRRLYRDNFSFDASTAGTYNFEVRIGSSNYNLSGKQFIANVIAKPKPNINVDERDERVCRNEEGINLAQFINSYEGDLDVKVYAVLPGLNVKQISEGETLDMNDVPLEMDRNFVLITYTVEDQGCTDEVFKNIYIDELTAVEINLPNAVCNDGGLITLAAMPTGGLWSGEGVNNGVFDPSAVSAGVYEITYEYTNEAGCTTNETKEIEVLGIVDVEAGDNIIVCQNGAMVALNGSPGNGTWEGVGIVEGTNFFDPDGITTGTYQLTYTVDGGSCSGTDKLTMTIVGNPKGVEAGPNRSLCLEQEGIVLSGQSPFGGYFEGTGIESDGVTFSPRLSGEGIFEITYIVENEAGCLGKDTRTITVNGASFVEAGEQIIICQNQENYNLANDVSPQGGTFEGNGVNGSLFQPASAGAGSHKIIYTYTNEKGCISSDTRTILVDEELEVEAGPSLILCESDGIVNLDLDSGPGGGYWSGTGIVPNANTFNPAISGEGTFVVTYEVSSINGCKNSDSRTITVQKTPGIDAGEDRIVCSTKGSVNLLIEASPKGGVFEGSGVTDGIFNPELAGIGTFPIKYTYGEPGSTCEGFDYINITVVQSDSVSAGKDIDICLDAAPFSLIGENFPLGGVFSGNGVLDGTFNPALAGEGRHQIKYTFSNGACVLTDTKTISVIKVDGDFWANSTELISGDLVEFDTNVNGTDYFWDFGDNFGTSTEKRAAYYYYGVGNYTVRLKVKVDGACEKEFVKNAMINVKGEESVLTSTHDKLSDGKTIVYPIPFEDEVFIEFSTSNEYTISLFDVLGKILFESKVYIRKERRYQLNLVETHYSGKVLFLKVQSENQPFQIFKLTK